jgi:transketolase
MKFNSNELAWLIRRDALEMTHLSKGSHIASVYSMADFLAVLYTSFLNFDEKNPNMEFRDKVILSKGHAGAGLYSVLANLGYFDKELLKTHYQNGSNLSGHVSHKKVPGIEFSTGSLGHGLSVGAGLACGAKINGSNEKIIVILGDGECDEGSIWEAALISNHFKLNNLIAIIDYNKMQSLDFVENTISLAPLDKKWSSFGWKVISIDGHNHDQIKDAFKKAFNSDNRPYLIIANTIKGKGVSFMENNILWHYRYPHEGDEYNNALSELNKVKPKSLEKFYIK